MVQQMLIISPQVRIPISELRFRFSRSSGAGGQNVNKVSTRVELLFDVMASASLTDAQKYQINGRLRSRITADGLLKLASQESRSQWKNREVVVQRLVECLARALRKARPRVATSATSPSRERRLSSKKIVSRKKASRRMRDLE